MQKKKRLKFSIFFNSLKPYIFRDFFVCLQGMEAYSSCLKELYSSNKQKKDKVMSAANEIT